VGRIGACGATVPEVMYQRGLRPRVSGRPPSALWLSPQRVTVGCGVLAVSQRLPVRGTHRPWFLARTTTALGIFSLFQHQSRGTRGALSRPTRTHIDQLRPTINSEKLSEEGSMEHPLQRTPTVGKDRSEDVEEFDAIIIGAGVTGLYALYRLR